MVALLVAGSVHDSAPCVRRVLCRAVCAPLCCRVGCSPALPRISSQHNVLRPSTPLATTATPLAHLTLYTRALPQPRAPCANSPTAPAASHVVGAAVRAVALSRGRRRLAARLGIAQLAEEPTKPLRVLPLRFPRKAQQATRTDRREGREAGAHAARPDLVWREGLGPSCRPLHAQVHAVRRDAAGRRALWLPARALREWPGERPSEGYPRQR
jgi:hypothetical protein